jgi:hypothetical protein
MYGKTSDMRQLNTFAIVRLDSRSDNEQIFQSATPKSTQRSPPTGEAIEPSSRKRRLTHYEGEALILVA